MSFGSYTESILVQQATADCLNQWGLGALRMRHEKGLKPIEFREEVQWDSSKLTEARSVTVKA